jgi:hypothetical protein
MFGEIFITSGVRGFADIGKIWKENRQKCTFLVTSAGLTKDIKCFHART